MAKKEQSRTVHSISNSFWGTFYRVLHMVFPVVLRGFIIRQIGVEYVGLNSLFTSIFQVLNLTELGFGAAVVYMMYKPIAEDDKPTIRRMLTMMRTVYRVIGAVILIAGLLVLPFLRFLIKKDVEVDVNYYLLYVMYLFQAVMSYLMYSYKNSVFTAYQRTDVNYQVFSLISLVQYVGQILILLITRNYYLYIAFMAILIVPQNLLIQWRSKREYPELYCEGKPTKEEKQELITKIKSLFGHRLGNTVMFSIDSIIISSFIGVGILAKYDNYTYILTSVCMLLNIVRNSLMASVGNKIVLDSTENCYQLFKRLSFLWMGVVCVCTACFAGLYQSFITVWVGKEFLFRNTILICIVLYFFVRQFRQMGITMKDAAGLWEADRWKPYIGMAANTVFSILFVLLVQRVTGDPNTELGLLGVMVPTMVILVFLFFPWETHVLFKYLFKRSAGAYYLLMARCVITAFVGVAAVFFLSKWLPVEGIPGLILRAILSVAVSAGIYAALNCFSREFKESLGIVKGMLKRVKKKFAH